MCQGTRFTGPVLYIQINNSTAIVNSVDNGDGRDWDTILLVLLLFILFGIVGTWI